MGLNNFFLEGAALLEDHRQKVSPWHILLIKLLLFTFHHWCFFKNNLFCFLIYTFIYLSFWRILPDTKLYIVISFGLSSHQCNRGYQDVVCFCWHQNWHHAFHWNSQTQFQSSFKVSTGEYCAVHLINTGE